MRICIVSKYPPIEGGVSARVYWLAKALGEHGHEVHIVTNALEVEDEYKEQIDNNDQKYSPQNVYVHSITPEMNPWHIPFSKAYAERIANIAIEIIEKYDIPIIDTYYILPYAISGFIAKSITGRPQILRHAGNDIDKLFSSDAYETLFKSIFKKVDKIITIPQFKKMFLSLGVKESVLDFNDHASVDTNAFKSEVATFPLSDYIDNDIPECPIITYIGKINYYWQTKGLYELIEAVKNIKTDFRLLFIANGKGLIEFKNLIKENNLEDKSIFIDFIPPWKVPSVIKLSTCVVIPEREFPIPNHMPILPREVMAVGKCLIISRELYNKKCYGNLIDGENVLVVDPKKLGQFSAIMKGIIQYPEKALRIGETAYQHSIQFENFNEYVNSTIECYRSLI